MQELILTGDFLMKRKRIRLSNSNLRENILNEETIDSLFSLLVPIGTILPYAGNRLLDELVNFTLCDGKELVRLEYPKLFNVIGTDYGEGNGSTTFNVPDLTSRFLEGSNIAGTVKEAGIPNIKGALSLSNQSYQVTYFGGVSGAFYPDNSTNIYTNANSGSVAYQRYINANLDASRSSSVYGNSSTVQPASVTVKYIIRCR